MGRIQRGGSRNKVWLVIGILLGSFHFLFHYPIVAIITTLTIITTITITITSTSTITITIITTIITTSEIWRRLPSWETFDVGVIIVDASHPS